MNAEGFHKRKTLAVVMMAAAALIVSLIILLANTRVGKTFSPNGKYLVTYNRLNHIYTVEETESDARWHASVQEEPSFLWSDDGNLLAVSSGQTAVIENMNISSARNVPNKSVINKQLGSLKTEDESLTYSRLEVTAFLDQDHLAVKFSWPADEPGYTVTGWFIYEYSTYSISQLTASKIKEL